MERFILSKNTLAAARDYLPLAEKKNFVGTCAPLCFDRLQVKSGEDLMPEMYKENSGLRSRYLLYALVGLYLGLSAETEADDPFLLTEAEYDRFAGSHILSQLERMKRDADCAEKCYAILSDYRTLERWLNVECRGLLAAQNDAVFRQSVLARSEMAQLPALLRQLQEVADRKAEGTDDGEL